MMFRYRHQRFAGVLFVGVLLVFFLALLRFSPRRAPWYDHLLWNIIAPPQYVLHSIASATSSVWSHYIWLSQVSRENVRLQQRVAELEGVQVRSEEVALENQRLQSMVGLAQAVQQQGVAARVIANDPRAEFKSIAIDKGTKEGVALYMPVIGAKGLVGKVVKVYPHSARVLLINDPNSSVDVVVQRSRARALLGGTAKSVKLRPSYYISRLEYLRGVSDIVEDDVVVTSGLDRLFPSGIPVGTVKSVHGDAHYGVFQDADVLPYEDLPQLQEVMVLKYVPVFPEDEASRT